MGIQDRDYYRREGPSFLEQFADRGKVCKWLILINVVLFVVQLVTMTRARDFTGELRADGPVTDALILDTDKVVEQFQVWRLLSYAFLHSITWYHILFNMLFLWWFGSELEERYGAREFLTFYLLAAVLGGVAFVLTTLATPIRCLGASGAVSAVMVVFACLYPNRTVLLMFVFPCPIWVVVAGFLGYDCLQLVLNRPTDVAVQVHVAGGLFGLAYWYFDWRLTGLFPSFKRWKQRRARPPLRIYREDPDPPAPVPVGGPPDLALDEHLEAKLDAVLAKVSQVGKENLTESEKQILLQASEIYRKKRRD